jgi:cytochrome c oxidase assembly protein subunit 15
MMFNRFQKLQFGLCSGLFFLIVLGATVRVTNSGLSCPDWPLCYGEVIPNFNFRIFLEWFHRVIAGGLGLCALGASLYIWIKKEMPASAKKLAVVSMLIFLVQAWLGGQTVIQLLRTEIVTAHLMGGYLLFTVNLLIYFRLKRAQINLEPSPFKRLFLLLWLVAFGQAILGALVSSHYGGLACGNEFPMCNGSWIPKLEGVVAIHFVHRWNAIGLAVLVLMSLAVSRLIPGPKPLNQSLKWAALLILLQIILGISMIFTSIHPTLSVLHSLISLSIFSLLLRGVDHAYYR